VLRFTGEAHPVLEAPAVVVEPLIEERRPELIDQMVVRHRDLDPVEAAVAAAARRLTEGAHELGNLLGLQLVRDVPMNTLGDLRRRQEDVRLLAKLPGLVVMAEAVPDDDIAAVDRRDLELVLRPEPIGFREHLCRPRRIKQLDAVKDDDHNHPRLRTRGRHTPSMSQSV